MTTITNNSRAARTITTQTGRGKPKAVTLQPGESVEGEPVRTESFEAGVRGGRFTVKGSPKKDEPKAADK